MEHGFKIIRNFLNNTTIRELEEILLRIHKKWCEENIDFYREKAVNSAYLTRKETCSDEDNENVLNVNLLAPIRVIQQLLPNLKKSNNAKIVIIGAAVGGLNLSKSLEVSNTSSKFGLRGLVFSLRQTLNKDSIGITLINPGNVATEEVLNDLKNEGKDETYAIPLADLFNVIETVMNLSNRANINEIDIPNMQ